MLTLAIVSRNYDVYETYFNTMIPPVDNVELIYAGADPGCETIVDADIVLSEPDIAITFISNCSKLQWLQSTWAGNNKLQEHSKRNYALTGTKGIFTAQMREYVFAYLLYFQRKIPQFIHLQEACNWNALKVDTLADKRIGIMGLGSIGCEIAKTAKTFEMKVSAITAHNTPMPDIDYYHLNDVLEFAEKCDFIVNLLPETPQTIGVCNTAFFDAMKSTAVFINAGRGGVLKSEQTIVDALKVKKIKAAVLDVFMQEPLDNCHPFYKLENCYLTNHTAAVSDPKKVFSIFKHNLLRFTASKPLQYRHDFIKGY